MKIRIVLPFVLIALIALWSCTSKEKPAEKKVPDNLISYKVTNIFPHDRAAFTQGLVIHSGRLFESTGQYGTSWISEVNITTGVQDKRITLDKKYFGEGITILNNKIYQLTWQTKIGFVYDWKTFNKVAEFNYDYEGWGITHDGKNLIVSDGTDKLHILDTVTLKDIKVLDVKNRGAKRDSLNELEFIEGYVYANIWMTNTIVKIDPANGEVVGQMDLSKMADEVKLKDPQSDVLNGIAYEKKSKTILITGKQWPACYAIRLAESKKQEK
ncbi:MAG TPA: glutaminyl-peptide cyclotransferase [Cyclobacteriaceae bacterium]